MMYIAVSSLRFLGYALLILPLLGVSRQFWFCHVF